MLGGLGYQFGIIVINIFFPPLSVALIADLGWDLVVNCALFFCAVIPAHIHAFYVSRVFFSRRRKVGFPQCDMRIETATDTPPGAERSLAGRTEILDPIKERAQRRRERCRS